MFVLRKGTQMSMFRFKDSNQLHSHFVSLQEQIKIRKTKDKAPQSTHARDHLSQKCFQAFPLA